MSEKHKAPGEASRKTPPSKDMSNEYVDSSATKNMRDIGKPSQAESESKKPADA